MKEVHYLEIDGQLLQTLVAVYEEMSVTQAAIRLEVSQSTLSHRLERLRTLVGDPLFVRAGRGIVATPHAEEIVARANEALEAMRLMQEGTEELNPHDIDDRFVIASTDYERAMFLLEAYRRILAKAPSIEIEFAWDRFDNSEPLRRKAFDMAISPVEGLTDQDIKQRALFQDEAACFYDPDFAEPPTTLEEYAAAKHVRVIFSEADTSFIDAALKSMGIERDVAIDLPSVRELPQVMKGTNLIATVPTRLQRTIMADFESCAVPFEMNPFTFSLYWHDRTHASKKHVWLRQQIIDFIQHADSGIL